MLIAAALSVALWLPAVASAEDLTIYSSLPLVGPARAQSEDIVRAERLALEQNGNRAGAFSVRYVSLNDGAPRTGSWTPLRTVTYGVLRVGRRGRLVYDRTIDSSR